MDYVIVSWDSTNRVAVIQVSGCAKQTSVDVTSDLVWGTDDCNNYLETVAQSVLANMDPNSPTYDPSLVS